MNNDNNKKKVLMKSAMAFTFALAMFGANAGADVSAEEALTTGKAGFNSTLEDNEEDGDVQQGDEADNGDDTKGITNNMEESASEAEDDLDAPADEADAEDADVSEAEDEDSVSSDEEAVDEESAEDAVDSDVQQDADVSEASEASVEDEAVVEEAAEDDVSEDVEAALDNVFGLGAANGFNVFVKGDYNVNGADISSNGQLGNLAAGGNVTVPGDYTAGKVVVGGNVNGSFLNGTSDESIDFDEAFKQLENTSNSLASLEANGTVSQNPWWGAEINFNGSDPELNVFNITVEEFNAMRAEGGGQLSFSFNVPKGSHCVVNIIGEGSVDLSVNAGAFYAKEAISNGTDNNKNILFNLPNASNVTIQDNMGALMAVNADVKSAEGVSGNHFEGSLICNSYTGGNEFGANSYVPPKKPDTPDPDPDPEPGNPDPDPDPEPGDPDPDPDPEPGDPDPDPDPEPGDPDPDPDPEPGDPDPDPDPEPNTPEPPEDPPYDPYENIETFDEPEEDPDDEEPSVTVEFEESEVPLADSPFETFDDTPVPLADSPFADSATNPKTGEDMTLPAVSAAAAMASFMAIMIANKKKREEEAQG